MCWILNWRYNCFYLLLTTSITSRPLFDIKQTIKHSIGIFGLSIYLQLNIQMLPKSRKDYWCCAFGKSTKYNINNAEATLQNTD